MTTPWLCSEVLLCKRQLCQFNFALQCNGNSLNILPPQKCYPAPPDPLRTGTGRVARVRAGCQIVKLPNCHIVKLSNCQIVKLSHCQIVTLSNCHIVRKFSVRPSVRKFSVRPSVENFSVRLSEHFTSVASTIRSINFLVPYVEI